MPTFICSLNWTDRESVSHPWSERTFTAAALQHMTFPPLKFIVPGVPWLSSQPPSCTLVSNSIKRRLVYLRLM